MMTRVLVASAALVSACSAAQQRAADTSVTPMPNGAPTIAAIRPDSVWIASGAVTEVVLHGRGFVPGKPGHNTVMLGTATFNDVPASDDGTEIRFVIPDRVPSGGEAPPMPIDPGSYPVRVRTPNGDSNVVTVRVYR